MIDDFEDGEKDAKDICFNDNEVAKIIFIVLYGSTMLVIMANLCKDYVVKPLFGKTDRNTLVDQHQKE